MARRSFYRRRSRRYGRRHGYGPRKRHKYVVKTSFGLAQKWNDVGLIDAKEVVALDNVTAGAFNFDDGTYKHMTPVPSGTGVETRNGRNIILKSVYLQGVIHTGALAVSTKIPRGDVVVNMMIVRNRRANGVQPALSDIYAHVGTGTTVTLARRNMYQSRNFDILWKRQYRIKIPGVSFYDATAMQHVYTALGTQTPFEAYLKLNLPQTYINTGENIASVSDNALHFFAWMSQDISIISDNWTPYVEIHSTVRTRFLDNC